MTETDSENIKNKKPKRKRRSYTRLETLNCWTEARRRIVEGASPAAVARYIRNQGEYTDVAEVSVARSIHRWVNRTDFREAVAVLPALTQGRVIDVIQEKFDDLDVQVGERLDVIFEAEQLILNQRKRLDRILKLEEDSEDSDVPHPLLKQEIKLLAGMMYKHVEVLMDMGIVPRAPAQYQHLIGIHGKIDVSGIAANQIASLPPDGLEMLLRLERMLGSSKKMTQSQTGKADR